MDIFRYTNMNKVYLLFLLLVSFSFQGNATHAVAGDITWTCQGGNYIFQLVFYRDCNGGIVNTSMETIDVWGHPTLTSISVNFQSRTDISPMCTQVPGGGTPLDCGTGQGGGNGIGATEKVIYLSDPITISGTPPATGWIFTYQNFSRNINIINLVDPDTKGITLTSKMFAIPNAAAGGCVDNSPQFLLDPYFVSCSGDPYKYNMNAVDPDLDSLHISFDTPLDHFPMQTYNPPTAPVELTYAPGFSATSPTPGTAMNPGNIPAQLDPSSGELTFLSNNQGSYAVKIVARSYRNGVLIAEVDREIQLIVVNCSGTNSPPQITGPFGGLFETTINAGDLVNFTLNSTDVELLQDGSPQSNLLSASGSMFGTGFTSTGGCATGPCATLNSTPIISGTQGVSTTFNWQTDCDHLVTAFNGTEDMVPFHFVFKVQDDYCPVPKVTYATITINVRNPGIIQAPPINCIQSDATGDVTISWDQVADPNGTFTEYQLYTLENGLIGTVPGIGTTSFVDPAVGQEFHYYLAVAAGCDGNSLTFSDTISNIYLDVINPSNGTAVLQWNDPVNPALAGMNDYYHIYRQYPNTWSLYDSVPYGTNFYIDTIDICDVFLNYQIVLPNQPCDYTSNIGGDFFQDMITPDIPVIDIVTIDTLTNGVTLSWNENSQADTYGYVIYTLNGAGFIVEIDTVWGVANTSYTHFPNTSNGELTYSVAAFDSCFTISVPPTYQTSAKAPVHTSIFVSPTLDICAHEVNLSWTEYFGWAAVDNYEVFAKWDGQPWMSAGTSTGTTFNLTIDDGKDYCFAVKATSSDGQESFSNVACIFTSSPSQPSFNYLQVATVDGDSVILRQHIDNSVPITEMAIERKVGNDPFEEITRIPVNSGSLMYIDADVDVHSQSYSYRARVIDSCSNAGGTSNEAKTIFLEAQFDPVAKISYLNWSAYREFNGSIIAYTIYRGIDGVFNGAPIASVPSHTLSFEDDMNSIVSSGKICYRVEAVEATNIFGINEISRSNDVCIVLPPLIYIPNAFMPDGINKIFRPVLSDFDATDYDFTIFNRWGQVIFQTNLYDEGWDGIIPATNREASAGTYLYMVSVKDANGVEIVQRGHVTLLR